ncbi:MAG TPA: hypothetical protein VHK91_12335, partial [Flavisolibacter sp.]|nr:hypothetical protein [Flavisolibacter sp.]
MIRELLIAAALTFLYLAASAQEVTEKEEEGLENQAVKENAEQKDDGSLQQSAWLLKHPIAINETDGGELVRLHLISDLQAGYLVQYRKTAGVLIHPYELQAVPGWDQETIRRVLPYISFVVIQPLSLQFRNRFTGGERQLLFRFTRTLEKAVGYDTISNGFAGDRNQYQLRYQYRYGNLLSYGFVADKDAGERFFSGTSRAGFDFYSGHVFLRRMGIIKALALGDFTVNLGQGLIQWQALAFGKSTDLTGAKRQGEVLQPYRSAGEYLFNRGAGITVGRGRWEGTLFTSFRKYNALVDDSAHTYSSIQTSGLSRTASEIKARRALGDLSAGGRLHYHQGTVKTSFNVVAHRFPASRIASPEPYISFLSGDASLLNASMDYSFTVHNFHFFGEEAMDKKGHVAFINSFLCSLGSQVDVAVVNRRMDRAYQSFQSNAFTESGSGSGETGTYVALAWRPVYTLQVSGYSDHYRFPWLKYRVDAPAAGSEHLAQVQYQPDKKSTLYLRYRISNQPLNEPGSTLNA